MTFESLLNFIMNLFSMEQLNQLFDMILGFLFPTT